MEIKERVKIVLSDKLDVSKDLLTDGAKLSSFADDLDMIEIVMGLEHEFYIKVDDEGASGWITLGDVVDFVRIKTRSAGGDKDYDAVLSKINSQFGVSISKKVAGNFKSFQELVNYIYNCRS
ncbi:acyl carrier protein [Pseudomonas cichorii]|nr:acyl carrier protein [Pseudomonas cichorii]